MHVSLPLLTTEQEQHVSDITQLYLLPHHIAVPHPPLSPFSL